MNEVENKNTVKTNENEKVEVKAREVKEEEGTSFKEKVKKVDDTFNKVVKCIFSVVGVILLAVLVLKPSVYNKMIENAEKVTGNKYGRLADGELDNGKPLKETKEDNAEKSSKETSDNNEVATKKTNSENQVVTEKKKEPELLCTKPYYEEIANNPDVSVYGGLNELVSNFDSYKGKKVHLDDLKIADIFEKDGTPVYTCYDSSDEVLRSCIGIKFNNKQLQKNYCIDDEISVTGILDDELGVVEGGMYVVIMKGNCVLYSDQSYNMCYIYNWLKEQGDYNYELRPTNSIYDRKTFKAININTREEKYISTNDSGTVYWCDEFGVPLSGGTMRADGGELQ